MEDDLEDENSFGHKLRLSLDELLDYKSGILIYEIQEANLSKDDVYLQFYSGNQGYPDYITREIKKKNEKIQTTGDSVISDLNGLKPISDWLKRKTTIELINVLLKPLYQLYNY